MSEYGLLETLIALGLDPSEYWKYIEISFLSSEGISRFVESNEFNDVTNDIWLQICDRRKEEKMPSDSIQNVDAFSNEHPKFDHSSKCIE
jgi:hypothetical protein